MDATASIPLHADVDEREEAHDDLQQILQEDNEDSTEEGFIDSASHEDDFTQHNTMDTVEACREFVIIHEMKHNTVDGMLKLLQSFGMSVPSTARTLLKTATNVDTIKLSGREYAYLGSKECIKNQFDQLPQEQIKELTEIILSFNVDGLPLFKSSQQNLWPILCSTNFAPKSVFPVALSLGIGKPNDLEFFIDTVKDLKS